MAKEKILVVEDELIIAMEIKERLENLDYTVTNIVSSKKEAIEAVKVDRPNLVLMDIMLGGEMAGIKAAKTIYKEFDIPVVYLTAYSDEETLQQAKLTDPYGYILKPFEERELRSVIEIALYKFNMEKKLKESEQWFSTTLKCIGDAVITTDTNGLVTFMNHLAESLTGWHQKEAFKKDITKIFHISNEKNKNNFNNPVKQVLKKNTVINLQSDTILISKDGISRFIDDSAAPIQDDKGNLNGVVMVFRDISDRKKLEEQLRQSQKMEAIGILTGGISHDFNNLLTAIQAATDMVLLDLEKNSPVYQHICDIQESTDRAAELTSKLLLFSRMQPMGFRPIDINNTVENLLKILHRLIGETIQINTLLKSDTWTIKADIGTLEQILLNLAINAKEAMSNGGVLTIKTENVDIDKVQSDHNPESYPGKFVCLSIIDNGMGMDQDTVQHIFEPFFSTKKDRRGTGLGLAVVYGIVKEHTGWIDVSSKPNQGTTFHIYFPATSEKAEVKTEEKVSIKLLQGNGERILLVEDEDKVRKYLEKALVKCGYNILAAADSKEAIEIFKKENGNFHLIISDIVLPDESGTELVKKLLALKPDLNVLLTSGYPESSSKWSDIQKKGYKFLQKPFNLADLLQNIRDALKI